jgi:hypothetical protein
MEALRQFLDASVEAGIFCQPGKLIPPAHIVKHTGFLFDTADNPILRIAAGKREQSLAMIDCFLGMDQAFFKTRPGSSDWSAEKRHRRHASAPRPHAATKSLFHLAPAGLARSALEFSCSAHR